MGFLASELVTILHEHNADPWQTLLHMGVHPTQVARLKIAADDFAQVAGLPSHAIQQLRQELGLNPIEYARLQAGIEADNFMRLMVYHNYTIDEFANKSNAVFAMALKDKLATGGKSESVFPTVLVAGSSAVAAPVRRRGRAKKNRGMDGEVA